jgi:hypothetical protein
MESIAALEETAKQLGTGQKVIVSNKHNNKRDKGKKGK